MSTDEPRAGAIDAVVLAGGRAERLGGVSKPDVLVAGRRLLDHAMTAAARARRVVVVAPENVAVPDRVLRTVEDPPFGGPVAGLAAGIAELDRAPEAPAGSVLVLACDAPHVASAVPRLLAAGVQADGDDSDGAVLVDREGRAQWLTAVYRLPRLRERLTARQDDVGRPGGSMRSLVAGLRLIEVPARGREADDVDTPEDVARTR